MTPARDGFFELMSAWQGRAVAVHHDRPTGAWIFIAMHDDTLGPCVGGCRMKVYPRPEDGLRDALRLAEGMTMKWAAIDFPFGGGKSVLAIPRPLVGQERRAFLRRFGGLLNSLGGAYGTGEDLGTTPADMQEIAEVSEHVIGVHGIDDGPDDPGPFTALGVYESIRAALRHRTGSPDVAGRRILIQGVGHVGGPLARRLSDAGARLLLSDLDQDLAFAVSVELAGSVVPPDDVYDQPCDVYAPCAVGATLDEETIPRLACDMIVGSANNQLRNPGDAQRLHDRGILYAPDYIANAGGALAFGLVYRGERSTEVLERKVAEIGTALGAIFAEAEAAGESPAVAADRKVRRTLEAARTD